VAKLFSDLAIHRRDKRTSPNLISHPQGEQNFSKKRTASTPQPPVSKTKAKYKNARESKKQTGSKTI
jgi:hypothetical protein